MASAVPCRVVAPSEGTDTTEHVDNAEGAENLLALVRWPGVVGWWEKTWIDYLLTGDEVRRAQGIDDLAAGTWELASWTWRDTTKLDLMVPDAYFSVSVYFDAEEKSNGWYVDFRRPFTQTSIGLDTLDLMLDLVIESDLTYRWKDEDEYAQGRRLGVVSDAEHRHVQEAREQVIDLLRRRTGPFEDRWRTWRRDPGWPLPVLPADALTAAVAVGQSERSPWTATSIPRRMDTQNSSSD